MFVGRKGGGFGGPNLNFLGKIMGQQKTSEQAEDTLEDLKHQYRHGNKDGVKLTRELVEELLRENNERLVEFDNDRLMGDLIRLSPS